MEITWEFLQTRMRNFEINLLKSKLMQIWKSFSIYWNLYKHNALKILHSLSQKLSSYLPVKFVYFVKNRLFLTSREFLEFKTRNFFSIGFTRTRTYRKIFTLVLRFFDKPPFWDSWWEFFFDKVSFLDMIRRFLRFLIMVFDKVSF